MKLGINRAADAQQGQHAGVVVEVLLTEAKQLTAAPLAQPRAAQRQRCQRQKSPARLMRRAIRACRTESRVGFGAFMMFS